MSGVSPLRFRSEADLVRWGEQLGRVLQAGDSIGLSGQLGAGKTCLARGILQGLGFAGEVASPSFAIVHPYDPPDVTLPVLHCDFYRLDSPEEAEQLGLDDYYDDGVIIAEWPEKAHYFTGNAHLAIGISIDADHTRCLSIEAGKNWEERLSCQP
ncbi:tRNA (adenosine(37)-N6)-threonylcarbamoyltransferase complex ATPase subunit type 1 TsaE [Parasphingorhabdus sp. DH2-15]|uniref:tRNA (adenosine(37)-N6)-threonylcarbamoyltransferase complex ATPase subunit type 1 TsaE n=1 Tax=Parasphingorhabdus sp. DH2-15 TaxID=3444112 RepID=UPI003F6874B1